MVLRNPNGRISTEVERFFPELTGRPVNGTRGTQISTQAQETIRTLLGGAIQEAGTRIEDLLRTLLWTVPGDGYARRSFDLATARSQVEIFNARGRGRSVSIVRADGTDWELQFEGGDVLPGSELPVGAIIELRGFHRVFVSNSGGGTGRVTLVFETTSLGR